MRCVVCGDPVEWSKWINAWAHSDAHPLGWRDHFPRPASDQAEAAE